MSFTEFLYFCGGGTLTVFLLLVLHWFPWVSTLTRMQAYSYGVGAICAGFVCWRLLSGDYVTAAGLAGLCIISGITVYLAYIIDDWTLRMRQAKRLIDAQRIEELEKD